MVGNSRKKLFVGRQLGICKWLETLEKNCFIGLWKTAHIHDRPGKLSAYAYCYSKAVSTHSGFTGSRKVIANTKQSDCDHDGSEVTRLARGAHK